jgi:(2Fe-2S) ferredoxin
VTNRQRCAFVCRGPYCADRGSKALKETLLRHLDGETTAVRSYPCFGRCDRGPNVFVYPDGVWYASVEPGDLPEIAAHLLGGAPVRRLEAPVDPWYTRVTCANIEEVLGGAAPGRGGRFRWPFWRRAGR